MELSHLSAWPRQPEVRECRDVVPFVGDLAFIDPGHNFERSNGVFSWLSVEIRSFNDLCLHGNIRVGLNLTGQLCSIIVPLDCRLIFAMNFAC